MDSAHGEDSNGTLFSAQMSLFGEDEFSSFDYPLVATNWTRKLSIVSFNSKRHFPLMFSLFSFAPCVF